MARKSGRMARKSRRMARGSCWTGSALLVSTDHVFPRGYRWKERSHPPSCSIILDYFYNARQLSGCVKASFANAKLTLPTDRKVGGTLLLLLSSRRDDT